MNKKISTLALACLALTASADKVYNQDSTHQNHDMPTMTHYKPEEKMPTLVKPQEMNMEEGVIDYSKMKTAEPVVYKSNEEHNLIASNEDIIHVKDENIEMQNHVDDEMFEVNESKPSPVDEPNDVVPQYVVKDPIVYTNKPVENHSKTYSYKEVENVEKPTLDVYKPETKEPTQSEEFVYDPTKVIHFEGNEIEDNKDFDYIKCEGYNFIARECAESVPNTCGFKTYDLEINCGMEGGCFKAYRNPCEACKDSQIKAVQIGPGCPAENYTENNTYYTEEKKVVDEPKPKEYIIVNNDSNKDNNSKNNYIVTDPIKYVNAKDYSDKSNDTAHNKNYIVTDPIKYVNAKDYSDNSNDTAHNNNYINKIYRKYKDTVKNNNNNYNNGNYVIVGEPTKITDKNTKDNNYTIHTTQNISPVDIFNTYDVKCKEQDRDKYCECKATDSLVCARLEDHTTEYYRCPCKACADRHVVSYSNGLCCKKSNVLTPYYCKPSDRFKMCTEEYSGVCAVTERGLVELGTQCQACTRSDVIAVYKNAKCTSGQTSKSNETIYNYKFDNKEPNNGNYIIVGEPQKIGGYTNKYSNNGNYIIKEPIRIGGNTENTNKNYIITDPVRIGGNTNNHDNYRNNSNYIVRDPIRIGGNTNNHDNYNNNSNYIVRDPVRIGENTYNSNKNYKVVSEPSRVKTSDTYYYNDMNSSNYYDSSQVNDFLSHN